MSWLPAVRRCLVAGPFGAWLLGFGFSRPGRSGREAQRRGKVYRQHPAQGAKQSPGLRGRFEQGHHLGLGELVLQLAAEAGRLIRQHFDQPGKICGPSWPRFAGRTFAGRAVAPPPRGPQRPGLGAGDQGGKSLDQAFEPGMDQQQRRPDRRIGAHPHRRRLAQPADDEAESFGEAGCGNRCCHEQRRNHNMLVGVKPIFAPPKSGRWTAGHEMQITSRANA
jgi:hypothetical protein